MKKPRVKTNDTWHYDVRYFIKWKPEDYQEYHRKAFKEEADLGHSAGYTQRVIYKGKREIWIYTNSNLAIKAKAHESVLAHEGLHATDFILEDNGIHGLTKENAEAYCYLLQWIIFNSP